MVLKRLASFFFILLIIVSACSSSNDENARREFDEERISQLNSSDKFDYDREFEIEESDDADLSWLARFFGGIFSALAFLFNNVLGYVFLIGLVALLVYLVVKNSDAIFVRRGPMLASPVKFTKIENIEEVDYDILLARALKKGDYTLAVRYHFLKCLKYLQKSKLINWHLEKTNYEYLLEVPDTYYQPLNRLIYIYEYVWYGKFSATEETYQKLVAVADDIHSKGGNE